MAITVNAGMRITSSWLNQLVPQTPVPWASIASGWQNSSGNVPAQASFLNSVTVLVSASLAVTANAGSALGNVTIGTLPSGMYPPISYNGNYSVDGNSATGYFLNIRSNGSIICYGLPALTTSQVVGINCVIRLDG